MYIELSDTDVVNILKRYVEITCNCKVTEVRRHDSYSGRWVDGIEPFRFELEKIKHIEELVK